MILGREHVVAFENPTYKQAYRLFRGLAYKTVPVGMDKNGMKVTELSDSGADIAYVTPSHQYPTGIIMPIGRRMELLKWAKEEPDRYVIEDDYDSEFRYKGKPIPALQGYDACGKVIYVGTFSKSIAPPCDCSYFSIYLKRFFLVLTVVIIQIIIPLFFFLLEIKKSRIIFYSIPCYMKLLIFIKWMKSLNYKC